MVIGGLAGTILGGLLGGATGCIAGSKLGEVVDERVLDNFRCLACNCTFNTKAASTAD
jgi:hypothetical protein